MVSAQATAAPPANVRPRLRATRAPRAPSIDGRLDDPVWRLAPPESRFTQNFPDEGQAPTERTELRVLYDDQALYLGVRCFDDHPEGIVERLTRRDRDTEADQVTIDVSSKDDGLTAYHFDLNVSGVQLDGVRFDDTDYSGDWDGLWVGATSRDARGWTAEIEIPLRTLRYDGRTTRFGFQVRRRIERRQEVDEWAYVPRTARGEVSYYGTLTGLDGLRARRLWQIAPYVMGKLTITSNQPPLDGIAPGAEMGADLKVGLTSALTLDATLNPDFGQVEADQVVLNLTTFETFYPEKRPFFLEGAEIFSTPLQQFYSRRIGRAPPAPALSGDESLAAPLPDPRIWAAAKLSGLVAPRLTVAVLDALTAREDARVDTGPRTERRLLDPLTNFAVLRLKRELLTHSYVGVTATAVTRAEPSHAAAPEPGGLCPDGDAPSQDGRCTHDAYTGSVDANFKTADGTWGALAQVVGSLIAGGPSRTLPDGTVLGPGSTGFGIYTDAGRYGGKHWLFHLEYFGVSPSLALDDAGYLRRGNLHHLHPFLTLRTTRPRGPMLEGSLTSEFIFEQSWDGAPLGRTFELNGSLRFKNFWQLYAQFDYSLDHVDDRETRDGAFTERRGGWWFELWGKTDPRRKVTFELWTGAGRVQHGVDLEGNATLSLRVIPQLEIDLIPRGSWSFGDPRWFDTLDAGAARTYLFGDLDSRELDVTLRGTWTFTPRLTLQAYAQLFLAAGHYGPLTAASGTGAHPLLALGAFHSVVGEPDGSPDFRDGTINVNLVLRWEWRPGSTLIGVYTHASQETVFDPVEEHSGRLRLNRFSSGPGTDVFLLKLSALWG